MEAKNKIIIASATLLLTILATLMFIFYYGTIEADTKPASAEISINKKTYKAGEPIKIRPGKHNIYISKDGYEKYEYKDYEIKAFKKYTLKRTLATEAEVKLQGTLPYDDGEKFTIEARDDGEKYIYDIGLYAILNRDDQLESYNDQIRDLKPFPIEYIKRFGVNPNSINLNWLQEETKN